MNNSFDTNHNDIIIPYNDIPYNNINNVPPLQYDIIKEQTCTNSTFGTFCSNKYKTVYRNEIPSIVPPYSTDAPKENNNTEDLRKKSLELSCSNVNELEKIYNYNNEQDFLSVLDCINDPMKPINYDYVKDIHILRGNKVHKKSCNIKPDNFSNGKWIQQHNNEIKNSIDNKLFNINTKKKTS
jgi:hypothetical protein